MALKIDELSCCRCCEVFLFSENKTSNFYLILSKNTIKIEMNCLISQDRNHVYPVKTRNYVYPL